MPISQVSFDDACAEVFAIQNFTYIFTWKLDYCSYIIFQSVGDLQLHCLQAFSFAFGAISTDVSCNLLELRLKNLQCKSCHIVVAILEIANLSANVLHISFVYSVHVSMCMMLFGATGPFGFCSDELICGYSHTILHIPRFLLAVPWGVKASLAYSWPFG